jgi:hypothetical protein
MSPALRSILRVAASASIGALASACFYDHRMTQQIVENRKRARQAEGAAIAPRRAQRPIVHAGGVKLYVSTEYRKQHADWQTSLRDLVDQANAVLGAEFGVRLDVTSLSPWEPACDPERLDRCLEALRALDAGAPGLWVVGVMPALSRFTQSFDDLGMARSDSRYLVIRDVSDLVERAEIDATFTTLTSTRRDDIYRKRKQHKRLSAFLHEWAHTLDVEHVPARDSLMFAAYDDDMQRFDDASATQIGSALEAQFTPPSGESAAETPLPEAAAAPRAPTQVPELSARDQGDFQLAEGLAQSDPARAYDVLAGLVERYPASYPVQRLACGLLMQLGRSSDAQTVCPRAIALASVQR